MATPGERLDPANVMGYDRYGGGSVMICGGISYNGKTDLRTVRGNLNAVRYCADIITPVIVPYIANGNADVLQQDNARCHTAGHTQNVLAASHINTLDWPAKSPDLSPIEHLWDYLGRTVRGRNDVNNVNDLERLCTRRGTGTSTIHPTSNKQHETALCGCYPS